MTHKIRSKKEYHETMLLIYSLMNKGEKALSKSEAKRLSALVMEAERYEDEEMGLKPQKPPKSIPELIAYKMFERKMNQSALADSLGMSQSKVSEILNGKRKADIAFLKGVHKLFQLDAELLLKYA
ncbi:MAG: helix-turn-helix domain-containing protein [Sediminibacterium sp.]|nr:helix-turn-helix domain-containing protein [Sediminibacterium sp.]